VRAIKLSSWCGPAIGRMEKRQESVHPAEGEAEKPTRSSISSARGNPALDVVLRQGAV